jgi:hypothetical protein
MLESPRPCGANGSLDDPTVAMQRVIDQAMDLVPPSDAVTGQDEAALARLTGFISTVAGAKLIPGSYTHVAARKAVHSC